MIPAPMGITARYRYELDGRARFHTLTVVAFDDDGDAWVLGDYGLEPANRRQGFDGLHETLTGAHIVPGGGWLATWTDADGYELTEPIIGWLVDGDGHGPALVHAGDGLVAPASAHVRIHHPNEHEQRIPTTEAEVA